MWWCGDGWCGVVVRCDGVAMCSVSMVVRCGGVVMDGVVWWSGVIFIVIFSNLLCISFLGFSSSFSRNT